MKKMCLTVDMLIRTQLFMLRKDNQDNLPHEQAVNPTTADMPRVSNRSLVYEQIYAY
jgi:hypothetical protein